MQFHNISPNPFFPFTKSLALYYHKDATLVETLKF